MKLFSEFLVEKGLATEDQILSAVLVQLQKLPSLPEVIYQANIIPAQNLLAGLRAQAVLKCDLRQALVNLGHWSSEAESKVQSEWAKVRTPLGEILVSLGHLSEENLEMALLEYRMLVVVECDGSDVVENKKLDIEGLKLFDFLKVADKTAKAKEAYERSGKESQEFKTSITQIQGAARLLELHRIDQLCDVISKAIGDEVSTLIEGLVQNSKEVVIRPVAV